MNKIIYGHSAKTEKVTVVDFQITGFNGISKKVDKEIHRYWLDREFGNDFYYAAYSSVDEFVKEHGKEYPAIAEHLKTLSIDGPILIHWWW